MLETTVETPRGPLQLFVTHTSRGAECQASRVGELVRERHGDGPALLMGDFNTPETSEVLIALRKEASLVDAFRSTNPDVPGHTVWQRIEAAEPTVFRRVDYIFLLNGRAAPSTVRSSRVVFDQPGRLPDGTALWPSDHYGVFAEIDLKP
jgi:endonuclease/exonuclease/phosphatase family metal-dependent hydrolase